MREILRHLPTRSTSPPPIRRAEEAGNGIGPPDGLSRLLRSRLNSSSQGDRSKRSGRADFNMNECGESDDTVHIAHYFKLTLK